MTLQTIINLCLGDLAAGDPAAGDAADSQATTTPPMTPADFVRKATAVFETYYAERAIPVTPFLAFRTSDVIAAWMHLRAVETQLREQGLVIPPAKDSDKRAYANPLIPLAARAWDRLRRAIKELERALPKTKESAPSGKGATVSDATVPGATAAGAPASPPPHAGAAGGKRPSHMPVSPLSELGFLGPERCYRGTPTRRSMIRAAMEGIQFPLTKPAETA